MAWPLVKINSWRMFCELVDGFTSLSHLGGIGHLYRGQADLNWTLRPSLTRLVEGRSRHKVLEMEKVASLEFEAHAHQYLSDHVLRGIDGVSDWWGLMQHYRVATRLLDWTASPYVAAYFAVDDLMPCDAAVWSFRVATIDDFNDRRLSKISCIDTLDEELKTSTPNAMYIYAQRELTDRMIAQQSRFTVCCDPTEDHAAVIDSVFQSEKSDDYGKFIIPKELKEEFLFRLRVMNISANSLFPGIDGVGESVAELLRLMMRREDVYPTFPAKNKSRRGGG